MFTPNATIDAMKTTEGYEADAMKLLAALDRAVELSGLKESTYCMRYLKDVHFRARLADGGVSGKLMLQRQRQIEESIQELAKS